MRLVEGFSSIYTRLSKPLFENSPVRGPLLASMIAITASFFLVGGFHWLIGYPSHFSILKGCVMGIGDDSWGPMKHAYAHFLSHPNTDIYKTVFFANNVKFQYPPSSLLPQAAASLLRIDITPTTLGVIERIAVLVEAGAVAWLFVLLALKKGWAAYGQPRILLGASLAVALTLTFYPVLKSCALGQMQTFLNTLFAIGCVFALSNRPAAAGAVIGTMCLLKPQFGLFALWAILRRDWNFLIGWATIAITGTLIAVLVFGISSHFGYLSILSFLSNHGEGFYANQSLNGLLNRLAGNGNNLVWDGASFPERVPWIYLATTLNAIAMSAVGLLAGKKMPYIVDFIIAALAFTLASPIAWEHHYGIMPAAFVVAALYAIDSSRRSAKPRDGKWLLLAYILSASLFSITFMLAHSWANFLQSYLLIGALLLLWQLYVLGRKAEPGTNDNLRAT